MAYGVKIFVTPGDRAHILKTRISFISNTRDATGGVGTAYTLPEHPSSVFHVLGTQFFSILCNVMSTLVCLLGGCVVCHSSIYSFLLPPFGIF